jgi:hypothetical protein
MVETIRANDRGISNWQSWHNAAVGSVGFLLGDASLVNWAVNGASGFMFQMRRSVLPGGTWYEGSPVYHWYALRAYLYLLEGARHAGMDLYGVPTVKRMFDAPLLILLPDGTFPPFNDSDRVSIDGQRGLYEYSFRQFRDPRYGELLEPRDSYDALFWGADACKGTRNALAGGVAVDGVAVLRDVERDTTACLDFGPGLSGHVQPSKLNLVLYAHGDLRLIDPGRVAYGNPLQKDWYRQTIAHNTVVMGCESQAVAGGKLRLLRSFGDLQVAWIESDEAYPGIRLDRTLLHWDRVFVDVFRCRATNAETFDLPLHFNGALSMLPRTEPLGRPLSQKPGYRLLEDTERIVEPLRYFYVDCGEGNRLFVQVFDASECFVAKGIGPDPAQRHPVLVRRQRTAEATFVTVYQAIKAGHYPSPVECRMGAAPVLTFGGQTITVGDAVEIH